MINNHIDSQNELDRLVALNQQLQTILDVSPAMIFYKDKENRFIYVNKKLAQANGLSKQEMEGKTCWELYSKKDADNYYKDDQEVIVSGKSKLNIIEKMETKNGALWVQTNKILYRDVDNQVIGVIGFTLDITKSREAEIALNAQIEQIEKMNQMMTGRELKMVELKENNEILKNKIKQLENKIKK